VLTSWQQDSTTRQSVKVIARLRDVIDALADTIALARVVDDALAERLDRVRRALDVDVLQVRNAVAPGRGPR
jgi:hypothetical protein